MSPYRHLRHRWSMGRGSGSETFAGQRPHSPPSRAGLRRGQSCSSAKARLGRGRDGQIGGSPRRWGKLHGTPNDACDVLIASSDDVFVGASKASARTRHCFGQGGMLPLVAQAKLLAKLPSEFRAPRGPNRSLSYPHTVHSTRAASWNGRPPRPANHGRAARFTT
ncbi:hypothetical protein VUR80DRAFT_3667 [Thermomyces stellatus]